MYIRRRKRVYKIQTRTKCNVGHTLYKREKNDFILSPAEKRKADRQTRGKRYDFGIRVTEKEKEGAVITIASGTYHRRTHTRRLLSSVIKRSLKTHVCRT